MPFSTLPTGPGLKDVFSGVWSSWVLPGYAQSGTLWLQRIHEFTPGATATAGWDSVRGQCVDYSDGSYGVGWQVGSRMGYLAPVSIKVGRNDHAKSEMIKDGGLVLYQGPTVLYQPLTGGLNPYLTKGDVLIFPDGKRFVVADTITPAQVWGTTIITVAALEERSLQDIIYALPTV